MTRYCQDRARGLPRFSVWAVGSIHLLRTPASRLTRRLPRFTDCSLDKLADNQVIAIVLGTWACSSVATYVWVSLTLYKYHWQGQDLQWVDYILGPLAPTRPIRAGFDTSHQDALLGVGLFNSELDENFVNAEREIAEHNAKIEAEALAAKAAAAAKSSTAASVVSEASVSPTHAVADPEAAVKVTAEDAEIAELKVGSRRHRYSVVHSMPYRPARSVIYHAALTCIADAPPPFSPALSVQTKLAVYEAKSNSPRKKFVREWKEDFARSGLVRRIWLCLRFFFMFGIDGREISDYKSGERDHLKFAPRWESKTEKMYNSLNVITSCIQAFAHGEYCGCGV